MQDHEKHARVTAVLQDMMQCTCLPKEDVAAAAALLRDRLEQAAEADPDGDPQRRLLAILREDDGTIRRVVMARVQERLETQGHPFMKP